MPSTKQHAPLVWYAGYGSNLSRGRFMSYISGGTPAGPTGHTKGAETIVNPEMINQSDWTTSCTLRITRPGGAELLPSSGKQRVSTKPWAGCT